MNATVTSLKEEISKLKADRETHLKQITSLTESVEEYQSELAIKQAHSLHLENQLKGWYNVIINGEPVLQHIEYS